MVAPTLATTAPAQNGLEVPRNVASGADLAQLEALGIAPVGLSSGPGVAPTRQPEGPITASDASCDKRDLMREAPGAGLDWIYDDDEGDLFDCEEGSDD